MQLSVTCPRCESRYRLAAEMRGKRMRCPNAVCRAVFEVRDDSDPVKPIPSEPEAPAREDRFALTGASGSDAAIPDDFPGDDEPSPEPSSTAITMEAWQPEASPMPMVEERPPIAKSPRRRRHLAMWAIGAMVLALAGVAGVSYWRVVGSMETNEAERFQKAEEKYQQQEFAEASAALQKLQRDFAESPHSKKYRFLAELSDVRQAVYQRESADETVKSLERMLQLVSVYSGAPLLKERETDLWQTFDFLAQELTKLAEREKAPLLPLAKRAWTAAKKYPPPTGTDAADREAKLAAEWTRIDGVLALHLERQHVIATLKQHLSNPIAVNVQEAWELIEKTDRQNDAEVRALLNDLFKAHLQQIQFVPASADSKSPSLDEDRLPSLSVMPSLQANREVKASSIVLALARGVLYALEPGKGELRWARRVGIDTHLLPLRVPADALTPELVLAVSSDQRSVSAVIAETGQVLWQTPLSDACVGQPVLADHQVLVPTLAGRIEQIELAEGRLIGAYHVGQPLTLGGVRQPGTPLVYFPADEFCVYAFDTTKRICTSILYTRHPPGSLPGLPTIIHGSKKDWLIWAQTTGAGRASLKPFSLPIENAEQKPGTPVIDVAGLSAVPWQQADRLAIMTNIGNLSLWGLRQAGTRDALLFPLQPDLSLEVSKRPGRCQVVFADAENYWTLTHGRLQRVQATFDPSKGPGLVAHWNQPITLGTLLHEAQTRQEPDGQTVLFLTTQAENHPTCVCSAVSAADGKILWQRQLGALPLETPFVLDGAVILPDAAGLLRFDQGKMKADQRWQSAGDWLAQEPWSNASKILLRRENSYVQLTAPSTGTKWKVRVGGEKPLDVNLPAALQGTPALGDGFLLLPLANGLLVRVDLADGSLTTGPDWRAAGAEDQAVGHVTLVSAADFVRTDGSVGVARIDAKTFAQRAAVKLTHRITRPPVVLPAIDNTKARLCVADASNTLTLLDADGLTIIRRWTMPGKITAGPFVRGGRIGCVVGKNRLIWLDPNRDALAWDYPFAADIVGEPNLIDGVLVVADIAGHFIAIDPHGGRLLGAGLTMKANVAATAAPLSFGPNQVFAPLTDGTIVLVPLDKLR